MPVRDNSEGFLALSTGRADARFATDDILLFGLQARARPIRPTSRWWAARSRSIRMGCMIQKNSTVFLEPGQRDHRARWCATARCRASYDKWFTPLQVPMSTDLAAAFKILAGLPN